MKSVTDSFAKVLPLPRHFDHNEIFILVNLLGFLWVIFLAKRFPLVVKLLILLFAMCNAILIDHALAGPPLDLYDLGDTSKYELFDELGYLMYTPYAYLFIYIYDKLNPKGFLLSLYVILMSLFGLGFEWVADYFHVFTYKKWNLLYSFPVYLTVSIAHIALFKFLMAHFNNGITHPVAITKKNGIEEQKEE